MNVGTSATPPEGWQASLRISQIHWHGIITVRQSSNRKPNPIVNNGDPIPGFLNSGSNNVSSFTTRFIDRQHGAIAR
jgi:hypothetical protein